MLAFSELFTRFGTHAPVNPAKLYQISHALTAGNRLAVVTPIEEIRMACHLAPRFQTMSDTDWSATVDDILEGCKSFYFNPFSSNFMYAYTNHWRLTT